jgi:hypothetical protein
MTSFVFQYWILFDLYNLQIQIIEIPFNYINVYVCGQ